MLALSVLSVVTKTCATVQYICFEADSQEPQESVPYLNFSNRTLSNFNQNHVFTVNRVNLLTILLIHS